MELFLTFICLSVVVCIIGIFTVHFELKRRSFELYSAEVLAQCASILTQVSAIDEQLDEELQAFKTLATPLMTVEARVNALETHIKLRR